VDMLVGMLQVDKLCLISHLLIEARASKRLLIVCMDGSRRLPLAALPMGARHPMAVQQVDMLVGMLQVDKLAVVVSRRLWHGLPLLPLAWLVLWEMDCWQQTPRYMRPTLDTFWRPPSPLVSSPWWRSSRWTSSPWCSPHRMSVW
jgi:hypothetical protein